MVSINFSLGCLRSAMCQRDALVRLCDAGIKKLRIWEPFAGDYGEDVEKIADRLAVIMEPQASKQFNLMVGLGGSPVSWLGKYHYPLHRLVKNQQAAAAFTNRFYPHDLGMYLDLLSRLVDSLNSRGLLKRVEWEIGHEPNSPEYFWGTRAQYQSICTATAMRLPLASKKHIGGFAPGLFNPAQLNGNLWLDFIENDPLFDRQNTGFSSSLYHLYGDNEFNYDDNLYPVRRFRSNVVSEWNYAAKLKKGSAMHNQANSPLWAWALFRLLKFCKARNISEVYLHETDIQKGMWKQFWKIWNASAGCAGMSRGFQVMEDRIVTAYGKQIIFESNGNWTIV